MTDQLFIAQTPRTPELFCDAVTGTIRMTGRCTRKHSFEFFPPFVDWIKDYLKKPATETLIEVYYEYVNTGNQRFYFEGIREIDNYYKQHPEMKVKLLWYYEEDDDDCLEMGQLFSSRLAIPVEFVEIPEED